MYEYDGVEFTFWQHVCVVSGTLTKARLILEILRKDVALLHPKLK